jgi:teichuronic acid exporter
VNKIETLKTRTIRAFSWGFIQELARRILQFGIGIFLARLLAPEAFGVVAVVSVIIEVARALLDSGFGSALIQRKQVTDVELSSVFYLNVVISTLLAGVLWLAAPAIAAFYNQPLLKPLLQVFTLVLFVNGFAVVQDAWLVRNLDFKRQAIILTVSVSTSGVVGLLLAWRGFGVWSLVVQQITNSVIRTGMLWKTSAWRPKLIFSVEALVEMFGFGSRMAAATLLATISESIMPLILAKLFSLVQLGYYNRAQSLQYLTTESISGVINRVTFPVFSELQDQIERLRAALKKAITTAVFVQFPIMIGLICVAKPLVLLLLTKKWAPCIPYLQLLCLVGLLYPAHVLNLNVLLGVGRSGTMFKLTVIKRALLIVTILTTFHWGIIAMIWGLIAHSIAAYVINSFYTKRLIGYSIRDQVRDLYPYLAASVVMGLGMTAVGLFFPPGDVVQLVTKTAFGAAIYLLICWTMRLEALGEFVGFVWRRPLAAT